MYPEEETTSNFPTAYPTTSTLAYNIYSREALRYSRRTLIYIKSSIIFLWHSQSPVSNASPTPAPPDLGSHTIAHSSVTGPSQVGPPPQLATFNPGPTNTQSSGGAGETDLARRQTRTHSKYLDAESSGLSIKSKEIPRSKTISSRKILTITRETQRSVMSPRLGQLVICILFVT